MLWGITLAWDKPKTRQDRSWITPWVANLFASLLIPALDFTQNVQGSVTADRKRACSGNEIVESLFCYISFTLFLNFSRICLVLMNQWPENSRGSSKSMKSKQIYAHYIY